MNTFVPYGPDYCASAVCLDTKRLVKQLVECQQIYDALRTGLPAHILHHPATQMWSHHEGALLCYASAVYAAYRSRFPGRDHKSGEYLRSMCPMFAPVPTWVEALAPYHRTKLHGKDPVHYAKFAYDAGPDLAHYPVTKNEQLIGWVHKPGNKWLLDDGTYHNTAWVAIQAARSKHA